MEVWVGRMQSNATRGTFVSKLYSLALSEIGSNASDRMDILCARLMIVLGEEDTIV